MKRLQRQALAWWLCLGLLVVAKAAYCAPAGGAANVADQLRFAGGDYSGWTVEGDDTWGVAEQDPFFFGPDAPQAFIVHSLKAGESAKSVLRSPVFTLEQPLQVFWLAGADGTPTTTNGGKLNYLLLRSWPDGAILRKAHTPGTSQLVRYRWVVSDLLGRKVYLELVDANPKLYPRGFAWIGLADYRQVPLEAGPHSMLVEDLYALPLDFNAELTLCRTVPGWLAAPEDRGSTLRKPVPGGEKLPVGSEPGVTAEALYVFGLINYGWDRGTAHWGEHPELEAVRNDQVYVGARIGTLALCYADGTRDEIPLVIGATAWFYEMWAGRYACREPFASRPEYRQQLEQNLKLCEDPKAGTRYGAFYLAIKPRSKPLEALEVLDNPAVRGTPLVSGVTLRAPRPAEGLKWLGKCTVNPGDLAPRLDARKPAAALAGLKQLASLLYTRKSDLPETFPALSFSPAIKAATLHFEGGRLARMLNNYWVANLEEIAAKFVATDGVFHESAVDAPWYGGYGGIGTWTCKGVYHSTAFGRCSDHYATLALRWLNDERRCTAYVDFVDKWLYFYRADHDPAKGPPNAALDISRYPKEAPPHWSFGINSPISLNVNEIAGTEEMDGHGATCVGRWVAWRRLGAPTGEWLTAPRKDVYGKSRWDATRDAAEFICWFLDYTGRDVMYSEGETTGWAGPHHCLQPPGMMRGGTPEQVKYNYANASMYEPYPTFVCATALECSVEMAEALGEKQLASKWRKYATRLLEGMKRLLRTGSSGHFEWRVSPYSVYPSLQDSLVPAWFALYRAGLDPLQWEAEIRSTTYHTFQRQLAQPYGFAPVLGMGYGQGWLTQSALVLDEMDAASKLLQNLALYSWDKNMNYVDTKRKIDWRKWQWIFPEGTNLLPDGSWHRIGDLGNGANQGIAMHALEACSGLDDTHPEILRLLPRVPEPLLGLEVRGYTALVEIHGKLTPVTVNYHYRRGKRFTFTSSLPVPALAIRLGPFAKRKQAEHLADKLRPAVPRVESVTSGHYEGKPAWWVWVKGVHEVDRLDLKLE